MSRRSDLRVALEALWRLAPPGPKNLYSSPEFKALSEACAAYGGGKPVFGLGTALRALGLPSGLSPARRADGLPVERALSALEKALTRRTTVRRYLCPLDLAQPLPPLQFGKTRVQRFSAAELAAMFDAPRLGRYYPDAVFEPERLALFQWLVVEERVRIDPRPEARAMPFLYEGFDRDTGAFDPHRGAYPDAVEAALFFLLQAPWEDWSNYPEVDWRGFRIPWIHAVDEDLFVRPPAPPRADSLTLEPWITYDHNGEEEELETPTALPLDDAADTLADWTEAKWQAYRRACRGALLRTPVAHFLVRGFAEDGMDEVMAHMTCIEAALGTQADHFRRMRPKTEPRPYSATDRVGARITALLDDAEAALTYRDLFDLRSAFVHGRSGLAAVSTIQRVAARRLARRVAAALTDLGAVHARSRDAVLETLLRQGRPDFLAAADARDPAKSKAIPHKADEQNPL